MKNITWTCHICKKERPDNAISVYSSVKILNSHSLQQNVRYCNDNDDCKVNAKTFSFFKKWHMKAAVDKVKRDRQ